MKLFKLHGIIFFICFIFGIGHIHLFGAENTILDAEKLLRESLSDTSIHNYIGDQMLLKNKNDAIKFAENILFPIYGKKAIVSQKPYEVNLIEKYWIITGNSQKSILGGNFIIIIDSRDYRIVRISYT